MSLTTISRILDHKGQKVVVTARWWPGCDVRLVDGVYREAEEPSLTLINVREIATFKDHDPATFAAAAGERWTNEAYRVMLEAAKENWP